jgi:hypothetical protein
MEGESVSFSVLATGASPLVYQWKKDGLVIAGAMASSLTLNSIASSNAGTYTVLVTNSAGSVTSLPALLTVISKPTITQQPSGRQLGLGATGTLSVSASGAGSLSFQWYRNNVAIAGATSSTYAIGYALPADGGSYFCRVTSSTAGSSDSNAVSVDVVTSTGNLRLINTSTRINVGTGDSVLITGLVIDGVGRKSYLIRAVGPALTGFGVGGVLADPELTVYSSSGTELAYNDNWPGALSGIMSGVGAFALPAGSKDAAVVVGLSKGSYTFKVSGIANTSGVALLEVYELP